MLRSAVVAYVMTAGLFSFHASAGNLQFRHITEKQGLKHTWIQHITKDSRGYMWFSTIYGAYRYDGFGFEEYEFPFEEGGELARVNVVYETSSGYILFGTNNGVWLHDPLTGSYLHSLKDDYPVRLNSIHVADILEDASGNLYIAGNGGVDRISPDGNVRNWRVGYARAMMADTRETIWVGTEDGDLYRHDSAVDEFEEIELPSVNRYQINDLFQSSDYDIFVSTTGGGLLRYQLPQREVLVYSVENGTLPSNIVRDVVEDGEGVVYAATELGLVSIVGGRTEFITSHDDNIWSLNDNAVYSLFCDESDNLWVGTFFGGVNVRYSHFGMFDFMLSGSEEYSADSKVVSSIVRSDSRLYIGTENDGIHIIEDGGKKLRISTSNSNITSNNIHTICVDSKDNLWVGTYYGGLFMRPAGRQTFRRFTTDDPDGLTSDNIYTVCQDSRSNLWVGTQYGGLYRYDYDSRRLERFAHEALGRTFVWDVHEDRAGDIWIACYGNGIWRLAASECYAPLKIDTPARNFISICELRDGRILAGTEKEGLVSVNPMSLEVEWINTSDGLPDNTIYGILQDDGDNVWMSTNTGLCRADAAFTSFANYTIADGLPTNRFNYNACAKLDGKLYFGCINGVVVVDTSKEVAVDVNRPIRFNTLYINNVRQQISPDGVLTEDLNEIKELKLKHWQNSFGVEFSPNIFGYSSGQSFAYKMAGVDSNWHVLGAKHRVDFMGLKPGTYTLMVAGVDDNAILDNVSSLKIRIIPVWWQSSLAKICFSLLVILLIIWLTRMFLQASRHKHELELEKFAREKDKEINEMKFRFFVNISHEFKTPLSLILGPVEQFINGRVPQEMMQKYFNIIQKNADKLLALINELLAFREVQFANLKISRVNMEDLVGVVLARHEWLFENKNIDIVVEMPGNLVLEADAGKLEKILDNLLSNAYKHTDVGGRVLIKAALAGENVSIVIEDNGAGIPEDKLPYIFERFFTGRSYDMYSSGVGLSYVSSLVEQHGGTITAASEVGRYTRMEVLLPLKAKTADMAVQEEEKEYKKAQGTIKKPEAFAMDADYDKEAYRKFAADTVVLIVEDDPSMRELLMDHFGRKYMVMGAESGEVAAKIIHENKVDMLISDVMLSGGMSGFELCHYVKNSVETSHIKVILMTVLSEQDYKYHGYHAGADAYLIKPFSFSILELQVRNLLMNAYRMRESYKIEIDMSNVEVKASNTDEQLIRRVVEVVFEHLGESEFAVDDLCMSVGMSKATLYRKLKALTGQSTNEFIQSTRLKYAARILAETDRNISEVAYEVGFSDPYYFSRAFKKVFGVSPKQWREKSGKDSANN